MADVPETLEALQARHRKEQRDLVSKITQKKKQATKKTRRGVNDDCERLELEMKERQARELAIFNGEIPEEEPATFSDDDQEAADTTHSTSALPRAMETLSVSSPVSEQITPEPTVAKKKVNKAKARLARRAAEYEALVAQAEEEAANMPDLREQERTRMAQHFDKHKLEVKEIRADGHCLYAAVADQMETRGLGLEPKIQVKVVEEGEKLPDYKKVRYAAADLIESNPDDFVGFMEEPLETYLENIRETGEWGGHMELMALARTYGVRINVLHSDGRVDKIEPEDGAKDEGKDIWLGYYRHSHGLGEHYNSLRKAS